MLAILPKGVKRRYFIPLVVVSFISLIQVAHILTDAGQYTNEGSLYSAWHFTLPLLIPAALLLRRFIKEAPSEECTKLRITLDEKEIFISELKMRMQEVTREKLPELYHKAMETKFSARGLYREEEMTKLAVMTTEHFCDQLGDQVVEIIQNEELNLNLIHENRSGGIVRATGRRRISEII